MPRHAARRPLRLWPGAAYFSATMTIWWQW